jgi:hypothetical protein
MECEHKNAMLPFSRAVEAAFKTILSMNQLSTIWALQRTTYHFLCFLCLCHLPSFRSHLLDNSWIDFYVTAPRAFYLVELLPALLCQLWAKMICRIGESPLSCKHFETFPPSSSHKQTIPFSHFWMVVPLWGIENVDMATRCVTIPHMHIPCTMPSPQPYYKHHHCLASQHSSCPLSKETGDTSL